MPTVGYATLQVIPSVKGIAGNIEKQIAPEMDKAGDRAGKGFRSRLGKHLGGIGNMVGGALTIGAGVSFLKGAMDEAREAQKVGAQTATVLKSTGNAANITAKQIGNVAGAISAKAGIDDEAIQSGENLLLTFTNVRNEAGKGNDVFNQATQTMTDMSASLGQGMKSSAIQLGKALNDPIKGVTALGRVGVSFTDQQKDQIKTMVKSGHTMDAQKLILGELHKEFGGSAAATATAGDKMNVAFGNFKETVGTALMPLIDRLATFMTSKIVPALSSFVTGIQDGTGVGGRFALVIRSVWQVAQRLGATLLPIAKQIGKIFLTVVVPALARVAHALGVFFGFLHGHQTTVKVFIAAVVALGLAMQAHAAVGAVKAAGGIGKWIAQTKIAALATKAWAAVQWILNAAMSANPILLIVVGLVALAAGLVIAYRKSATFRRIVAAAFGVLKGVVSAFLGFFTHTLPAAFTDVWHFLQRWGVLALAAFVPFIGLPLLIVQHWRSIVAFFSGLWRSVTHVVGAGVRAVVDFVRRLPGRVGSALGNLGKALLQKGKDLLHGLWLGIKWYWEHVVRAFYWDLPKRVVIAIGNLAMTLLDKGKDLLAGLLHGQERGWKIIGSWLGGRAVAAVKAIGELGSTLLRKGRDLLGGLWDGLKAIWRDIAVWIAGLPSKIAGLFKNAGGWLVDKGRAIFTGLGEGIVAGYNVAKDKLFDGINAVIGLLNKLVDGINWIFDKLHIGIRIGKIPLVGIADTVTLSHGGGGGGGAGGGHAGTIAALARGGVLAGYSPGRDSVPAVLSPGEGVLVPEAVRGLGGGFVHWANRAFTGRRGSNAPGQYGLGGLVSGAWSGIKSGVGAIKDAGGWLAQHGAAKMFDLAYKPVHWGASQIPGMAGQLAVGAIERIHDAVLDYFTHASKPAAKAAAAAAAAPRGGAARGPLQQYAKRLLTQMGWADQWSSFNALEMGEAGWIVNNTNPHSGAYGLPQALPPEKMASAGADWLTNGRTQLQWMMNYIRDRYGNPASAYSTWLSREPHWYDKGGWLQPGGLAYNGTNYPEAVFTRGQLADIGGRDRGPREMHVRGPIRMRLENVDEQLWGVVDGMIVAEVNDALRWSGVMQ